MKGIIFDIKELAVHDGPGPRTTVFFKGCPLRCQWCHNPEGLDFHPQLMVQHSRCTGCGLCRVGCDHLECQGYDRCLHACPNGLISLSGHEVDSGELAAKLLREKDFWDISGGGVTLSGGEPLAQPDFLLDLLDKLEGVHRCVETSGFAPNEVFAAMCARTELVMMDLKLADPDLHKQYTGRDNALILENLDFLRQSGHPCIIRTPLIPRVTDTEENLTAIAKLLVGIPGLQRAELLPYNPMAGAKYPQLGMKGPEFSGPKPDSHLLEPFIKAGVPAILA